MIEPWIVFGLVLRVPWCLPECGRHGTSKQALLAALLHESMDDYRARCAEALAEAGHDPARRLAAAVGATVRYGAERSEASLLLVPWRLPECGRRGPIGGHTAFAIMNYLQGSRLSTLLFECA